MIENTKKFNFKIRIIYPCLKTNTMIQTHPILDDFPEYAEKIKELYRSNEEFQVLLDTYSALDKEIYLIEKGEIPLNDDELTHKRRDRVFLKDEIYSMLKA